MKILLGLSTLLFSTFLFHKAAGTLNITKLNIISFTFYNLIVFSFIGASFVFWGFRDHYLINKITDVQVIYKTYFMLIYVMFSFPIAVIFFNYILLGKHVKKSYERILSQKLFYQKNENFVFLLTLVLTLISLFSIIYVFFCLGGVPVFKVLSHDSDSAKLRIEIGRNFSGNTYIKNILMLWLTPLLSYFSYIYFRSSHKKKWGLLFAITFLLSLLVKTYDFQKAPVIYYLFYFYIIEILLGNKNVLKMLVTLGVVGCIIIILQYTFIAGYHSNFLTLSSGPVGRIFMTQIATLFLHIQAFPKKIPYLEGASLPTIWARLFGCDDSWVRSGRKVMELYNPSGIKAGTAGVMNALFIGEAYANWGVKGVILAPLIVALLLSIAFALLIKLPKTPLSIILYLTLFISYTGTLHGGFVDYLYNIGNVLIIIAVAICSIMINHGKFHLKRPLTFKRLL